MRLRRLLKLLLPLWSRVLGRRLAQGIHDLLRLKNL